MANGLFIKKITKCIRMLNSEWMRISLKKKKEKQLSDSQLGGVLFCFGKISPFKGTVSQPQIL